MKGRDAFGLAGTTAIVTGATRGNGLAIARRLAEVGAEVVLTSRSEKDAAEAARRIAKATRTRALGRACDVSDAKAVRDLFRAARTWSQGPLSTVVNNAGYALRLDWWETPLHKFSASELETAVRSVAQADLDGSRWCTYYALPWMMKQRRGSLVYTSSTPALTGYQGTPYTEAKAAVLGLMRDVAREYGPRGIRANAIAPGNIRTDWLKKISAKDRRRLEKENSLQRFGEPSEIADVVLFLASDLSSFVTGETIVVDGGTVIR